MSSSSALGFYSESVLIFNAKNERVSLPFTGITSRMTTSDGKSTGYSEANEETELKDLVRKVSVVSAGARAGALLIHVTLQTVSQKYASADVRHINRGRNTPINSR